VEEPRPGEKRPRSSSPEPQVDTVLERLRLEGQVSKETGFDSYDHHRNDVNDQLTKEQDNTPLRDALLKKLEDLKIIWKNTCPELMEAKKETHAPAHKQATTLPQPRKSKSTKKSDDMKIAPPIPDQPYSECGKSKRGKYSDAARERCVQKYRECMASGNPDMRSLSAAVQQIRRWSGFEKMSRTNLRTYIKPGGTKGKTATGGQKVSRDFDEAVLSKLIYTHRNSDGENEVVANITYSHAIIQKAALLTRSEPRWQEDEELWDKLKTMKFCTTWCSRFLDA
jgi:hypothetical protein